MLFCNDILIKPLEKSVLFLRIFGGRNLENKIVQPNPKDVPYLRSKCGAK